VENTHKLNPRAVFTLQISSSSATLARLESLTERQEKMPSVFDMCCTAPPQSVQANGNAPVAYSTTTTSPQQQVTTKTVITPQQQQQQFQMQQQPQAQHLNMGQKMAQPVTNMLSRFEEKVPLLSPFTGTMRDVITRATSPDNERLNFNLVTGVGEVRRITRRHFFRKLTKMHTYRKNPRLANPLALIISQ